MKVSPETRYGQAVDEKVGHSVYHYQEVAYSMEIDHKSV